MENNGSTFIADLTVSKFFINKKQNFFGRSMIVFNKHADDIMNITEKEIIGLVSDLKVASLAIKKSLNPDKLNYSLLGNTNSHIHLHIYPRYKNDGRWGKNPFSDDVKLLTDEEYTELANRIRKELKQK